jgi:periplasmic copper chaperone A
MREAARLALSGMGLAIIWSAAFADTPNIVIQDAWSRPTAPAASTGVIYLVLKNLGADEDRLLEITTNVADSAQFHVTSSAAGIMSMRPVESLKIAPGATLRAEPGGLHIMLLGLKRPLTPGERFNARLIFARAGKRDISVVVRAGP